MRLIIERLEAIESVLSGPPIDAETQLNLSAQLTKQIVILKSIAASIVAADEPPPTRPPTGP